MRFRVGLPNNLFANMLASVFPREFFSFYYLSNSEILKELVNEKIDLAITPSLEILNEDNLFVSKKIGVAFDGPLSDDYIYYSGKEDLISIKLAGSVSLNEILLTKLIFRENYGIELNQEVVKRVPEKIEENYLISGNVNFEKSLYEKGDSLAEHVAQFLDAPYLKYIVVSKRKENIEMLHQNIYNPESEIELSFPSLLKALGFEEKVIDFVKSNFDGLYFELTQNEIDSFDEMRKIPFYYGLFEEVKEIAFVE